MFLLDQNILVDICAKYLKNLDFFFWNSVDINVLTHKLEACVYVLTSDLKNYLEMVTSNFSSIDFIFSPVSSFYDSLKWGLNDYAYGRLIIYDEIFSLRNWERLFQNYKSH